jgi:hypothetical protein
MDVLKDFYWQSYQIVQKGAPDWITLLHDSFRLSVGVCVHHDVFCICKCVCVCSAFISLTCMVSIFLLAVAQRFRIAQHRFEYF